MEIVQKNGGSEEGRQGPPETEDLLCESGRGKHRCNEAHDRHQVGVMLHQLRGRERGEALRQRTGH